MRPFVSPFVNPSVSPLCVLCGSSPPPPPHNLLIAQRAVLSVYIPELADRFKAIYLVDHIAWRSALRLTDSMFCLCSFSSIFSIVGRS